MRNLFYRTLETIDSHLDDTSTAIIVAIWLATGVIIVIAGLTL